MQHCDNCNQPFPERELYGDFPENKCFTCFFGELAEDKARVDELVKKIKGFEEEVRLAEDALENTEAELTKAKNELKELKGK